MEVRVDGRVAVVAGASRGIGEAIVRELLASGADGVVITGRRAQTLGPLAAELGDRVVPVVGNVSDEAHAEEAVTTAVERFGACDLLVNNAGTNPAAGALAPSRSVRSGGCSRARRSARTTCPRRPSTT